MSNKPLTLITATLAGALCIPATVAAQTVSESTPRAVFGAHIGASSVGGGAYEERASLWGFGGFGTGLVADLHGGAVIAPWLTVGGRLGMLRATSGSSNTDGAAMELQSYDAGAFARLGAVLGQRRVKGFLGVQLEGGAQWASVSLRGESTSSIAPRAAMLAVGQMIVGPVGFGFRVGPRFGTWSNAGGQGADLDLGGIEFSTGVEVRL